MLHLEEVVQLWHGKEWEKLAAVVEYAARGTPNAVAAHETGDGHLLPAGVSTTLPGTMMQAAALNYRVRPATDTPPDVESHQFLDWFGLELARAVAARLRADPSLLEIAHANLRRWLAGNAHAPGARRAFLEWRDLLAANSLEEVLRALTDPSEEGDRRRQSWPFVGVLTRDESRAIYSACEAAARTAHEETATAALAR